MLQLFGYLEKFEFEILFIYYSHIRLEKNIEALDSTPDEFRHLMTRVLLLSLYRRRFSIFLRALSHTVIARRKGRNGESSHLE